MPIMHTFEYRDSNYSMTWKKHTQLYKTKEEAHTAAQGKLIELSMGFTDRFNFEIKLTTVNTDPPVELPIRYTYCINAHYLEIRKKRGVNIIDLKRYDIEAIRNLIEEHNLISFQII